MKYILYVISLIGSLMLADGILQATGNQEQNNVNLVKFMVIAGILFVGSVAGITILFPPAKPKPPAAGPILYDTAGTCIQLGRSELCLANTDPILVLTGTDKHGTFLAVMDLDSRLSSAKYYFKDKTMNEKVRVININDYEDN